MYIINNYTKLVCNLSNLYNLTHYRNLSTGVSCHAYETHNMVIKFVKFHVNKSY